MRVRLRSELTLEKVIRFAEDRAPEFEALDGLKQKHCLPGPTNGEYAGL
jgi:hypothetical protein